MIILQDTREQRPWQFEIYDQCQAQQVVTLKTGDYTVKGLEDIVCIERKRTTGEIALNLGKKAKAFEAEMQRMSKYEYAYIICEFSANTLIAYPSGSGIPKKQWSKLRMNGKFMHKRLMEWCEKYGVECIFCNNKYEAELKTLEILYDRYSKTT